MQTRSLVFLVAIGAPLLLPSTADAGDNPFAAVVVDYEPGPTPTPGYTNSAAALGAPERFTGEGIFPSVVSPFNPPFGPDEIVSISPGGFIILQFQQPVLDDPNNLFGIDLIVFGNTGFIDGDWPKAIVAGAFGNDGGIIEVSANGRTWHTIPSAQANTLMPTLGYLDSGAYDTQPGSEMTDFTRPIDPALDLDHLLGLNLNEVVSRYHGSGGGTGIDLAAVGLSSISYIRISNPSGTSENIEIDAVADASPRTPGDANLDGIVNVSDLLAVIAAWGEREPGSLPTDFNNDGMVNVTDLLVVIGNWGQGP